MAFLIVNNYTQSKLPILGKQRHYDTLRICFAYVIKLNLKSRHKKDKKYMLSLICEPKKIKQTNEYRKTRRLTENKRGYQGVKCSREDSKTGMRD